MSDLVTFEKRGAIAVLTLNRPEKLNALSAELLEDLEAAVDRLQSDTSVRVAILTGAGEKAFAAGADIKAMSGMTAQEAKSFSDMGHRVLGKIESARVPVIGAVNGFALGGGCEVALACDFLYASETAQFGQPEVQLGVIPGFGGTQRLARRVGIGRARELCFTGERIKAARALEVGLVNAVVPAPELMDRVLAVAKTIASKGPEAVSACKRAILRGEDASLPTACELEAQAFASLFGSNEQREGMAAFLERRDPAFAKAEE